MSLGVFGYVSVARYVTLTSFLYVLLKKLENNIVKKTLNGHPFRIDHEDRRERSNEQKDMTEFHVFKMHIFSNF